VINEEVPYARRVERLNGDAARLHQLVCEQVTNVRCVDEDGILRQSAVLAEVVHIPPHERLIFLRILMSGCFQVVSPGLAVRQSEETLTGYAASGGPNNQPTAFK
jgi:hypothetical protein